MADHPDSATFARSHALLPNCSRSACLLDLLYLHTVQPESKQKSKSKPSQTELFSATRTEKNRTGVRSITKTETDSARRLILPDLSDGGGPQSKPSPNPNPNLNPNSATPSSSQQKNKTGGRSISKNRNRFWNLPGIARVVAAIQIQIQTQTQTQTKENRTQPISQTQWLRKHLKFDDHITMCKHTSSLYAPGIKKKRRRERAEKNSHTLYYLIVLDST